MTSVTNGTHRADVTNNNGYLTVSMQGGSDIAETPVMIRLTLAEGRLLLAALLAHGIATLR